MPAAIQNMAGWYNRLSKWKKVFLWIGVVFVGLIVIGAVFGEEAESDVAPAQEVTTPLTQTPEPASSPTTAPTATSTPTPTEEPTPAPTPTKGGPPTSHLDSHPDAYAHLDARAHPDALEFLQTIAHTHTRATPKHHPGSNTLSRMGVPRATER